MGGVPSFVGEASGQPYWFFVAEWIVWLSLTAVSFGLKIAMTYREAWHQQQVQAAKNYSDDELLRQLTAGSTEAANSAAAEAEARALLMRRRLAGLNTVATYERYGGSGGAAHMRAVWQRLAGV